jgi:nucleotide-binding universal stress UspA family protein
MTIRKILVPIDGTDAARPPLALAFALARRFGARVDVLHARIDPLDAVSFAGEGMSGDVIQELIELTEEQAIARAGTARALFAAESAKAAIDEGAAEVGRPMARFLEHLGREEDGVVMHGRLADLIVIARPLTGLDPAVHAALNAALFASGHPVLVPGREAASADFRRIMIAWNGSAEAARAVTAALPFLTEATQVTIAAPPAETDARPAQDLAEYLACHGIGAEITVLAHSRAAGESLLEASRPFDLLVMGAYTHSRLWQLILGGVTRHMLEDAPLPLLMAH